MKQVLAAFAVAAALCVAAPAGAEVAVSPSATPAANGPAAGTATAAVHEIAAPSTGIEGGTGHGTATSGTATQTPLVPVAPAVEAPVQSAAAPTLPAAVIAAPVVVAPSVVAQISLSRQRMEVSVDGRPMYSWPISTARKGYRTPVGNYRPQRMYKRYFSRKYDNAPMPYSIFFNGGYAIHGTTDLKRLGRPASHGCVRLHPGNAATLYALVRELGPGNTRIVVSR